MRHLSPGEVQSETSGQSIPLYPLTTSVGEDGRAVPQPSGSSGCFPTVGSLREGRWRRKARLTPVIRLIVMHTLRMGTVRMGTLL